MLFRRCRLGFDRAKEKRLPCEDVAVDHQPKPGAEKGADTVPSDFAHTAEMRDENSVHER